MSTFSTQQQQPAEPLAFSVIPPLQEEIEMAAVEALMQSLVLDEDHPVALELAGSAESRRFIVRANTPIALAHVRALLRARYPQIEIRPLQPYDDPLNIEAHEEVSVVELESGGAAYLPLRTWQETKQEQEQVDPIPGLLSALSELPEQTRAIAQIALVPAPTLWSQEHARKAVENPLEQERRADQTIRTQHTMMVRYSGMDVASPIIMVLGACMGAFWLLRPWLPAWSRDLLPTLLSGRDPHLSPVQIFQMLLFALGLLVVGVLVLKGIAWVRNALHPNPIYDMRQVERKTSRMAYRARLFLYVISSRVAGDVDPSLAAQAPEDAAPDRARHSFQPWWQLRAQRLQDDMRRETLLRLIAVYRQFHLASGAYFAPKYLTPQSGRTMLSFDRHKQRYGWSKDLRHSRHLLSVDALAALWHLPAASILPELALVEHRRARTLLLSPEIARQSAGLPPIGYSEHAGHRLPFALSPHFFSLHTLIAGKSGEGKSTCIEHIAGEAMKQGGLVLIDPHGDLCEHVLRLVPAERVEDVVLIDLSDSSASVGINPLDATLGRKRDKAISDLLKTLSHIWVSSWGPRMENAFEMALRTLFEANKLLIANDTVNGPSQQYTLMDVLPLLTNEHFCHFLLQQIDDDYLQRWWYEYYEPLTLMQQRDIINPVITKAAKFESVIARRIIGQSTATVDFARMISERKIILVKLAKGIIGNDVAAILGATLLGLIQLTLEEQGALPAGERVRFPIILDEFQVLAGVDYGALAELRKYGATFFLATQSLEYLQKLDQFLLPTVLANVKQLIIFHVSAKDAETLYKELGVEEMDILNLDPHTCYVKMASSTRRQPTFSLRVLPPPEGDMEQAEIIRTRCRVRYTCSVDVVDAALREAMLRGIRTPYASNFNEHPGRGQRSSPAAASNGSRSRGSDKQTPEVILLPAASPQHTTAPDASTAPHGITSPATLDEDAESPPASARRGSRDRRAGRRADSPQQRSEAPPTAFSSDYLTGEFSDEERPAGDMEAL